MPNLVLGAASVWGNRMMQSQLPIWMGTKAHEAKQKEERGITGLAKLGEQQPGLSD